MRILLVFVLFGFRAFAQEDTLTSFDAVSKFIKINESGDWVSVELTTHVPVGPHLLQTSSRGPLAYSSDNRVLLKFLYIWDISDPSSKRSMKSGTVTWKIRKDDWDKWRNDKNPVFILEQDCVRLSAEEVQTIKKDW